MNLKDSYLHGTDQIALVRALKWENGLLKYQSASPTAPWNSVGTIPIWNLNTTGKANTAGTADLTKAALTFGSKTFNGSEAKTITLSDLGGAPAVTGGYLPLSATNAYPLVGDLYLGKGSSSQSSDPTNYKAVSLYIGCLNKSMGLFPYASNWNSIGLSNRYWFRAYINNIYANNLYNLSGSAPTAPAGLNIGTPSKAATDTAAASAGVNGWVKIYNRAAATSTTHGTYTLVLSSTTAANITLTLPSKSGTLALTEGNIFTILAEQYKINSKYGINMNNSDIIGANSIYTADTADNTAEGIRFYRDTSHWDSLTANGGNLYFMPNDTLSGSAFTSAYKVYHEGNKPTLSTLGTIYWANIAVSTSSNKITKPQFADILINNGTTADVGCTLKYDSTNKCLKFVF